VKIVSQALRPEGSHESWPVGTTVILARLAERNRSDAIHGLPWARAHVLRQPMNSVASRNFVDGLCNSLARMVNGRRDGVENTRLII
jgi:hypothetical protein